MSAIDQYDAIDPEAVGIGDRYRFWRANRHDALECLAATFRTHRYAPHFHETYAIGAILDGCEAFRLRGARQYAPAGYLCFVNPEEVHDGEPCDGGFSYRMTYPSQELVRQIAGEILGRPPRGQPFFHPPVMRDGDVFSAFLIAHRRLEADGGGMAAEEALIEAYALALSRYADLDGASIGIGSEPAAVRRARDYLRAYCHQPVKLGELADVAGLSRYHLIRVFRRHVGLTPHAFLMDERVRAARMKLREGLSPAEVATDCGFVDQSHLTRLFKARVGVTPSAYARR